MGRLAWFIVFFCSRIFLKCRNMMVKLGIQMIRPAMARPSVSSFSSSSLFLTCKMVRKMSLIRAKKKAAKTEIETMISDAVYLKYCSLKNRLIVIIA